MAAKCKWTGLNDGWQAKTKKGYCLIRPGKRGYLTMACHVGSSMFQSSAKTPAPLKASGCKRLK
jgi:hypothetical protein